MPGQTKLQSTNIMLSAASESPVSSLSTSSSVEVDMAVSILDEATLEVCSIGWFWNTREVEYSPDSSGYIAIPTNILEIDSTDNVKYTIRSNKLFNLDDGTNTFTGNVTLCVKELLEWDDLPQVAKQYITLKAARKFTDRTVGTSELARFTRQDEQEAFINLRKHESNVGDYTIFGNDLYRASTRQTPANRVTTF